jgi:glycosyltransferase involved in cell wall biosynthesis
MRRQSSVLRWLLLAAEGWLAGPIAYLALLSVCAILHSKRRSAQATGAARNTPTRVKFAILLPAHNEEAVLGKLLASLAALEYPKDQYTIYVVADNCTDQTAALARATGLAQVYERFDPARRGKGYALHWLLAQLEARHLIYDAYVIFDADSIVEPTFLRWMAKELEAGAQALQGREVILNAAQSPGPALRSLAFALVQDVRHLGRNYLGASAALAGNGMCLSRSLLERYPWQAFSPAEDYEYYLTLVEHGERVRFVPEARLSTRMPATFAQMRAQDIRWETSPDGESTGRAALRLLNAGLRRRDKVCLEAAAELITPPLSFLGISCLLSLLASLLLRSRLALFAGLLLCGGLLSYLGAGLYLLRPSRAVYKAFLYAPGFLLWKLWVYLVLKRSPKHRGHWTSESAPDEERSIA